MRNLREFYDYVDTDGINIIKIWLDQLEPEAKAKINARLNTLEQSDLTDWKWPYTEVLQGDKDGLIAVRIKYQRIQIRLLGYYGPQRGNCTLLACCTERNNKYIPLDIGRIASQRRAGVETNPSSRRTRHDFN